MTTYGCLVGAVACLPFAGQLIADAADAPLSATLNMVYLGVFPTALAFTTWAYALARTTRQPRWARPRTRCPRWSC